MLQEEWFGQIPSIDKKEPSIDKKELSVDKKEPYGDCLSNRVKIKETPYESEYGGCFSIEECDESIPDEKEIKSVDTKVNKQGDVV